MERGSKTKTATRRRKRRKTSPTPLALWPGRSPARAGSRSRLTQLVGAGRSPACLQPTSLSPEEFSNEPGQVASEEQFELGQAARAAGLARRNPRPTSRRATTQSKPMPALGHRSDQARLKRVVPDGREPAR